LRRSRGALGPALTGLLAGAVLGVLVGAVWALAAPTPEVRDVGGVLVSSADEEFQAAQTATFALLAVAAGLVQGVVLAARPAGARVPAALGAVAGGLVGSLVAWRLGAALGPSSLEVQREAGDAVLRAPLDVHAVGVLGLWPATTAAVLFVGLLLAGLLSPAAGSAGDGGADPAGEAQQVGRGQLDVQPAPPAAHQDGGQ
jgi:hypothetical protein